MADSSSAPVRTYPTEVLGHPVPLNDAGIPDVNHIAGLAAYVIADCDRADGDARGFQDARNATGRVTMSTTTARRLVVAALTGSEPSDSTDTTSPDTTPADNQHASSARAFVDRVYADPSCVERYLRDSAAPITADDIAELEAIEPLGSDE